MFGISLFLLYHFTKNEYLSIKWFPPISAKNINETRSKCQNVAHIIALRFSHVSRELVKISKLDDQHKYILKVSLPYMRRTSLPRSLGVGSSGEEGLEGSPPRPEQKNQAMVSCTKSRYGYYPPSPNITFCFRCWQRNLLENPSAKKHKRCFQILNLHKKEFTCYYYYYSAMVVVVRNKVRAGWVVSDRAVHTKTCSSHRSLKSLQC